MEYVLLTLVLIGIVSLFIALRKVINTTQAKNENNEWLDNLKSDNKDLNLKLSESQSHLNDTRQELVGKNAEINHLKEKLAVQEKQMTETQKELKEAFEKISHSVLRQNSQQLRETHEEKLKDLLDPLGQRLNQFAKAFQDNQNKYVESSTALKTQLDHIRKLNESLSKEAKNLTEALKGDKKLQGNWGEEQLERLLQFVGFVEGINYDKQVTYKDEEGIKRPDFVVYLPDNKNIIIDSKVSLVDYDLYYQAETDEERAVAVKRMVQRMDKHVKDLFDKGYANFNKDNQPDYILMYVPIEPALMLALSSDPDLFNRSLNKNIVLVSNTTIMSVLKIIQLIWKQDSYNKNANQIAEEAGKMMDKLKLFLDSFEKINHNLNQAQDAYQTAHKQLSSGRGNLLKKAKDISDLGVEGKHKIDFDQHQVSEE